MEIPQFIKIPSHIKQLSEFWTNFCPFRPRLNVSVTWCSLSVISQPEKNQCLFGYWDCILFLRKTGGVTFRCFMYKHRSCFGVLKAKQPERRVCRCRLSKCDFSECVAQQVHMIEPDIGDNGKHGLDHIVALSSRRPARFRWLPSTFAGQNIQRPLQTVSSKMKVVFFQQGPLFFNKFKSPPFHHSPDPFPEIL